MVFLRWFLPVVEGQWRPYNIKSNSKSNRINNKTSNRINSQVANFNQYRFEDGVVAEAGAVEGVVDVVADADVVGEVRLMVMYNFK